MKLADYDWGVYSFCSHLLALFVLPFVLIMWPLIALFVKWQAKALDETVPLV
mgnify:CR=1 FL=1|tara:strand:- start:11043 stop:11198 length:156 start_codon:yes stop_codon:yes gene_type:complete